ncbi:hypothetical protein FO519_003654 [Halicephalobus sp. NKZ332]|nr:hypothetical protein FO519_003654 [Halicephalobus sp. NKZ332]
MNLIKKIKNLGKKEGGSGHQLGGQSSQGQNQSQGYHLGEANNRHVPSDAKDAAKLAAERRLAAEQEKKAQKDALRLERQMKVEEERLLQQKLGEMSIQERKEYDKKLQEEKGNSNVEVQNIKKKLNPVLYTSPFLAEGLIAGPANEVFQQLVDVIKESNFELDKKLELAARLFHTANSSEVQGKARDLITKMVGNICANPEEKKYREVKRQNRNYVENVLSAIGAELFLLLVGFEIAEVPEKGQVIRLAEEIDVNFLPGQLEILNNPGNPLELSVYRHSKVYFLADNAKVEPIQVPDWTFKLSGAEVAALQKEREKEAEWWMTVCSKRRRTISTPFKVSVIRVRFPNSAILEAMFAVDESISDVINYIGTLLDYPPESFILNEAVGNKFDLNSSESIGEAKLVPYALLHFKFLEDNKKYPFPDKNYVKICDEARKRMNFIGVDIADYKF